jgi:alkyl sulfatase BDS1-like metallo-beta-lactamase superfamily hydrolase
MLKGAQGNIIWDPAKYNFVKEGEKAPDTVNPSLWRQSQLLNIGGLFKVTDGVYQIRNLDLSNMTIIEGKTGITVIDPLLSAEPAKEALALYFAHRPKNRWWRCCLPTAMWTTTAVSAAWSMKPM